MVSTNTSQKRLKKYPRENVHLFISTGKLVSNAKPRPKKQVLWIWETCVKLVNLSSNSIPINERNWIDIDAQPFDHCCGEVSKWILWKKEEERRIGFQCCLNPYSSNEILYFRAIQGHSGENFVDPSVQDSILSPDAFAEYICHIGNAYEMHSIIHSELILGGRSG